MTQKPPPDLDAMARRVENFVVRARRVKAHSLTGVEILKSMVSSSFSIGAHPETGETVLMLSAPPEEAVESLAARVRPTILQDDPVHHGKVLNALRILVSSEEAHKYINATAVRWKSIDPKSGAVNAYAVQGGLADGSGPASYASDNTLAFSWFYGDLVHADEKSQAAGGEFSIRERYLAAVALVARIATYTLETLALIEFLVERGDLELTDKDIWKVDVVASETEWTLPAKIFLGEVGAEAPKDIQTQPGSEWTEISFEP